ncbi:MAG: hypothetical protein IT440_04015, partial [Phycisphaeraceae bacterium]|nr:hypothetical protein [Phycisphaeraceae bacterium]
LFIITPAAEVLELTKQLRPEGLGILVLNPPPVKELDQLFEALCRQCGLRQR